MKLKPLLAACALAGLATTAQADVMFSFSGTCSTNCSAIMPPNTFSGSLYVLDSFAGDSWLDSGEVTGFNFTFGSVNISSAAGYSVSGGYLVLGGTNLDILGGFDFSGPGPDAITASLFGATGWAVTVPNPNPRKKPITAKGEGGYSYEGQVPEPGTLALLGLGLAGLGLRVASRKK